MPNVFVPIGKDATLEQLISAINNNFAQIDQETVTKIFRVANNSPGFIQGKLPNDTGYGFLLYDGDNVAIACYITPDGTPVLKVAKDGYDALTATDDQLIFNSQQNVFKIAKILTGDIAIDFAARGAAGVAGGFSENSTNSLVLLHGLTYIPSILVYGYDTSQYIPISNGGLLKSPGFSTTNPQVNFTGGGAVSTVAHAFWSISVDATNVTILGKRAGFQIVGAAVGAITYPTASLKIYCQQETAN
jgi:hypothetical protein